MRSNPPKYHPGKDMEIALLIVVWSRGMDVAPKEQMSLKKISHWAIQIGDTICEYGLDDHELRIVTVDEWHDGGKPTDGKRHLGKEYQNGGQHPIPPGDKRSGYHPITIFRDWTLLGAHRIDLYARRLYHQDFKGKYNFDARNCQTFVRCLLTQVWITEAHMGAVFQHRSGNVVEKGRGADLIKIHKPDLVFNIIRNIVSTDGTEQVDESPVWHKKVAWQPIRYEEVNVPTFGQVTAGGGNPVAGITSTGSTSENRWFGGFRPREWICYNCKDCKSFQTHDICAICGHSYWW